MTFLHSSNGDNKKNRVFSQGYFDNLKLSNYQQKIKKNYKKDSVPPLIQFASNTKKQSPISSLKNSLVKSQYLQDQNLKLNILYSNQNKNKRQGQNYSVVHYQNPKINYQNNQNLQHQQYQNNNLNPLMIKQLEIMFNSQHQKEKQSLKSSQQSKHHQKTVNQKNTIKLQNSASFQKPQILLQKQENQNAQHIAKESFKLYNQAIQIYNQAISPQNGYGQLYWLLQKSSTELLSTLLSKKYKLKFYLQNLQHTIIQKKNQNYQKDMEILSYLLLKLINQKNQKGQLVYPQVFMSQQGIRIQFDPQYQKKQKQLKILQLKRKIYQKNLQIQALSSQYSQITENLARSIFNMGSNKGQFLQTSPPQSVQMMMSFRKSNQSSHQIERKPTFGGTNNFRTSNDSKNIQNQQSRQN